MNKILLNLMNQQNNIEDSTVINVDTIEKVKKLIGMVREINPNHLILKSHYIVENTRQNTFSSTCVRFYEKNRFAHDIIGRYKTLNAKIIEFDDLLE